VKSQINAIVLVMVLSACGTEVTFEPSEDSGSGGKDTVEMVLPGVSHKYLERPSCSIDEQDHTACGLCAEPYNPGMVSVDAGEFHHCYNDKANGCLEGDGTFCAAQHPEGSLVWLKYVKDICDNCAVTCCYFCTTKWGKLAP